ncbi:hypothetical protein IAG44_37820 [Streptomyces roseirectus]|uniref:Uncharacterized protein n=1 Tax=Streptomyces roseirectus TaxID=2768066 RepID=A0A7H0IPC9_9ACTN|nr:hypothetical protein [Streptomyces roseirectus]QNP74645.1 hypothetical protein IAG44_37820 [Streptomyces roseirectus]
MTPAPAPRNLPALLAGLHDERRDAAVAVSGTPGGTIHVRAGLVVAVDTPGAPGVESVLLKSGRVDDRSWAAARAADGPLDEQLHKRGLLSPEEFEVTCTAALFDGAFALALGPGAVWEVRDPAPDVVAARAFAPHLVAAETTRRLAVLTELWGSPSELARTRLRATDTARPATLRARHTDVLDAVNGRRTPRDLAFALGRGTYAVMLDLAHLRTLGLIHPDVTPTGRPSTALRVPVRRAGAPHAPAGGTPLPQRTPGTHHPHRSDTV